MGRYIFILQIFNCFLVVSVIYFGHGQAQENIDNTTECYLANGADYVGNQNTTEIENGQDCIVWSEANSTKYVDINHNYCRNEDESVAPWCYVNDTSGNATKKICNIPTCDTPAYEGCFNFTVDNQVFFNESSLTNDPKMKIERCLNFCRNDKYSYAGLLGGNSCYCGNSDHRDAIENEEGKVSNLECHMNSCEDNPSHACGGTNAMAVYNTQYGSCGLTYDNVTSETVYSPRWPGNYHNDADCTWKIIIPTNASILSIDFIFLQLESNDDTLSFYVDGNVVKEFNGTQADDFDIDVSNATMVTYRFLTDSDNKHSGFIFNFHLQKNDPSTTDSDTSDTVSTTTINPVPVATTYAITESASSVESTTLNTATQPSTESLKTTVHTPIVTTAAVQSTSVLITTSAVRTTQTVVPSSTVSATPPGDVTIEQEYTVYSNTTGNQTVVAVTSTFPRYHRGKNIGLIIGVILVVIVISMGLLVGCLLVQKRISHKKREGSNRPPPTFNNPITFRDSSVL